MEVPTVECWSVLVESMGIQARLIEFLDRLRYIKPALKGNDLINLGVPQGPDIGRILNHHPFPFALVKVTDPNIKEFLKKDLVCGAAKVEITKPEWLNL